MQCAVCQTRSPVGYCAKCHMMLCEVCGVPCEGCGGIACRRHSARDTAGRALCPLCQAREGVTKSSLEEKARPRGSESSKREVLTFEALSRELGDSEYKTGEDEAAGETREASLPSDRDKPERRHKPSHHKREKRTLRYSEKLGAEIDEDAINARVLTGSAPKGTPVWLSGAFIGVLACVTTWLLRGFLADPRFQRIGFGFVIVIALGAVIWSGSGLLNRELPPRERKLSLIGVVLGLAAAVAATLMRAQ